MIRKQEDSDQFDALIGQFKELSNDMEKLSAKKPDGALNTFKVKFVNQLLTAANEFLSDGYMPIAGFTSFDETILPTNSDIVVVLSQYKAAFGRFLAESVVRDPESREEVWVVSGKPSKIKHSSHLGWH